MHSDPEVNIQADSLLADVINSLPDDMSGSLGESDILSEQDEELEI